MFHVTTTVTLTLTIIATPTTHIVTCGTAEGCLAYLYEAQSLLNIMCLFQSTLNNIVSQNMYLCVTTVTLTQL
jgi:hypothetical protein